MAPNEQGSDSEQASPDDTQQSLEVPDQPLRSPLSKPPTYVPPYDPNALVTLYGTLGSREIANAFHEVGVDSISFPDAYASRQFWPHPWEMLVIAPLSAFFTAIAVKAGEDTWMALKKLVGKIFRSERDKAFRRPIMLGDSDIVELRFSFWEDSPDEAYKALLRLKLDELDTSATSALAWADKLRFLRYDPKLGMWVPWDPYEPYAKKPS
jgi:hypothetical protein